MPMSRNDQVMRQWFILRMLERPGGATIDEIVASLPGDYACHSRTIRRDLEALSVCFPLFTESVDRRVRWKLMEGFGHVPALRFSATELMAMVFTSDLARPLAGTPIKESLDSALLKMRGALPVTADGYFSSLEGWFSAAPGTHKSYREHRDKIDQLARAIAKKRTVEMRYFTAARDTTSRRKVDPYHIRFVGGALYLIGYCHNRKEVLIFAIDRIISLTVTNLPCQMPLGFDVEEYLRGALTAMRGSETIDVELRFDRRTSAWSRDRIWHPSQTATLSRDGRLTLRLQVADTPELVSWILSFGPGVRVARPDHLRDRVRETARQIAEAE
jgi:predicted DNA-binding transcriptional regulator YafY